MIQAETAPVEEDVRFGNGSPLADPLVAVVPPTDRRPSPANRFATRWRSQWHALLLLVDSAMLLVAFVVAYLSHSMETLTGTAIAVAVAYPLVAVVALRARGAHRESFNGHSLLGIAGTLALVAMVLVGIAVLPDGTPGRSIPLVVNEWIVAMPLVIWGRASMALLARRLRPRGLFVTPTLIVGSGEIGQLIARRLFMQPQAGLVPVGFLDEDGPALGSGLPLLGTPRDMERVVREHGIEHIVFAFSFTRDAALVPLVDRAVEMGLRISVVPRMFDAVSARMQLDRLGGLPIVALGAIHPKGWQFALKHAVDRVFAALALVLLSPLFLGIAIAVRLSSPGPILFQQRRVGRDGEPFPMLKFRTMRVDPTPGALPVGLPAGIAPGGVEGVDRRTTIGRWLRKTSLDELPQFLNVLRGEMSLIGPRPERVDLAETFAADVRRYAQRHRVKAGMTGWAQVHGLRGQTSLSDRIEWDNYYIRNWSPALDVRIFFMTLFAVLRANAE